MEQRALGQTGLRVSALGFGCGSVGGLMVRGDAQDQAAAVARALEAGITYFDTAPLYGNGRSEENLGRALRSLDAWDRVAVGTKVRLRPEDSGGIAVAIRASLEQSLRLLGRDSVDLLQLHNHITVADHGDGGLPAAEVLGEVAAGMRAVIQAGLVRHAGFTGIGEPAGLQAVVASGSFETVQAYFNAVNPSAGFAGAAAGGHDFGGLIDAASGQGMGVLAIRVLAAGALSGSAERAPNASPIAGAGLVSGGGFDEDLVRTAKLTALVEATGLESTLELAVRFALSKQGVSSVLVGLANLDQLEQALRWAERGPLPADVAAQVVAAAR